MYIENKEIINDISMIEEERVNTALADPSVSGSNAGIFTQLLTQSAFSSAQNTQNSSLPVIVITQTQAVPNDPWAVSGGSEQWHHLGQYGLNTIPVWEDYTGDGVIVAVMDDGFNYTHSELAVNYDQSKDLDTVNNDNDAYYTTSNKHGTHVSMVIASDDNGVDGVGVAFDSEIIGIQRGFNGQGSVDQIIDGVNHSVAQGADIMNNSWGTTVAFGDNRKINFTGTDTSEALDSFENAVENGRDGLGLNIVFSAGNSRVQGQSANYKNYQNSPYTITVGALAQDGEFAYFSEAGSNLLVTAPGDSIRVTNATDNGGISVISGTSFSAPAVSGVISLMLEANSELAYRDVQEILALSSRQVDAGGTGWAGEGWQFNGADNWNGGGMHFSHDYGYGNVDALAAVRLAETWINQQTYTNMSVIPPVSASPALAIPSMGTVTSTITVNQDVSIEHILIDLDIDHAKAGDLVVTLTSPDGTDSVLMYHVQNGSYVTTFGVYTGVNFEFSSTAHWGESSVGDWTLTIEDETAGNAGTLNNWSVSFLGSAQDIDDVYFYTDEYAGSTGARTILTDADGVDTINAAAVTTDTTINLDQLSGTIAGTIFIIDQNTVIENVFTGDGNDAVTGNYEDNDIRAGRGDDTIYGSIGDDTLDGGAGDDTVSYSYDIADFLIDLVDGATVALTHTVQSFSDMLLSIENFIFDGTSYTRAELDTYVANGGGQGAFNSTKLTLGLDHGTHHLINDVAGNFIYTEQDLGGASTSNVLAVARTSTSLEANVLNPGSEAIDSVILRNDALASIELSRFRVVSVDQRSATSNSSIVLQHVMRGQVDLGAGDDTVTITATELVTADPNDVDAWVIDTGAGDDVLTVGGAIANMFSTVYLGTGNDQADFNAQGNDRVYGEEGNDVIALGAGNDYAEGGNDNDTISGEVGNDHIRGGAGSDALHGGTGFDRLEGGDGDDTLSGGAQADRLFGDAGNDTLNGGTENDVLRGGEDDDALNGDDGNDQLYGDAGVDVLNGGNGNDFMRGGDGDDTLFGDDGNDKLYGDNGNDILEGGDGFDALYGGNDDDYLLGGIGNDRLYGGNGDDELLGGEGNDILSAGAGQDYLSGGEGADRFYGGAGIDVFELNIFDANAERFYNFSLGEDVIDITHILRGYEKGVDDINDFVRVLDLGGGQTDLRLNVDGDVGGTYGRAALIYTDFGGASVESLVINGTLQPDHE